MINTSWRGIPHLLLRFEQHLEAALFTYAAAAIQTLVCFVTFLKLAFKAVGFSKGFSSICNCSEILSPFPLILSLRSPQKPSTPNILLLYTDTECIIPSP